MDGDRVVFTTDYDIFDMHYKVINALKEDHKQVPLIEARIEELAEKYALAETDVQRMVISKPLIELRKTKARYENNGRVKEYIRSTSDLVDVYKHLIGRHGDVLLDGVRKDAGDVRVWIIRKYLDIAGMYCKHNVMWIPKLGDDTCDMCGQKLSRGFCVGCGTQSGDVGDAIHVERSSQYDTTANFMKFVSQAMGKHTTTPFKNMLEDLDTKAREWGWPIGKEVREMPMDIFGHRGTGTMHDLMDLMSAAGYSSRNKDKHLIITVYWGWELHDVNHFLDIIREDCILVSEMYAKVKRQSKSSEMNREYKYFKILQWHRDKLRHPLSEDQFDIITTPHILAEYESNMREICELINRPDRPYIPLRGSKANNQLRRARPSTTTSNMSTEYSLKFKENSNKLVASLIVLIKVLRDGKHIDISDMELKTLREYAEKQSDIESISLYAEKFFGGTPEQLTAKVKSIKERDETYFKGQIDNLLPKSSDSEFVTIVKPLIERFVFLLDAKTKEKDANDQPLPLIKADTKAKYWGFVDFLTRDAILHYSTTGQDLPELAGTTSLTSSTAIPATHMSAKQRADHIKDDFLAYLEEQKQKKAATVAVVATKPKK